MSTFPIKSVESRSTSFYIIATNYTKVHIYLCTNCAICVFMWKRSRGKGAFRQRLPDEQHSHKFVKSAALRRSKNSCKYMKYEKDTLLRYYILIDQV